MDYVKALREFHTKFNCVQNITPTIVDVDTENLRINLIDEEREELEDAMIDQDFIEIADGLGDLLFVVFGTAVAYGIDIDRVFAEVHRSNMSKVWPDGTVHYREDGKVIKPDTYSPADLSWVLEGTKDEATSDN